MADVSAVEALCRDRGLLTPELHGSNDFYGHAAILKAYCALPARRSLKVAVEHAIFLNDYVWEEDLRSRCPWFLCATRAHAEDFERRAAGVKRAMAIGPMLHYVPRPSGRTDPRRTLVAFPAHSSHRIRTVFDVDAFCAEVRRAASGFERVLVCVYWKDVLRGMARDFTARGFECVSAGHMFDHGFLPRLRTILDSSDVAFTNEVGSHVLYAAALGKPVWIERGAVDYQADSPEALATDVPDFVEHPTVVRLLATFRDRVGEQTPAQRDLVDELTGAENVKTPAEMRALLLAAEAEYERESGVRRRLQDAIHAVRFASRSLRARANGGLLPVR